MANRKTIEKALNRLKGQVITYNNSTLHLKDFEMDDERERVFIHFYDRGPLDRPYDSAMFLIKMMDLKTDKQPMISDLKNQDQTKTTVAAEVSSVPNSSNPQILHSISIQQQQCLNILGDNEVLNSATEIIKKTFSKIDDGSISLDHAAALNESIKSLIEIEKTKVAKSAMAFKIMGIH